MLCKNGLRFSPNSSQTTPRIVMFLPKIIPALELCCIHNTRNFRKIESDLAVKVRQNTARQKKPFAISEP
jgi:hypothetical protein